MGNSLSPSRESNHQMLFFPSPNPTSQMTSRRSPGSSTICDAQSPSFVSVFVGRSRQERLQLPTHGMQRANSCAHSAVALAWSVWRCGPRRCAYWFQKGDRSAGQKASRPQDVLVQCCRIRGQDSERRQRLGRPLTQPPGLCSAGRQSSYRGRWFVDPIY